MTRPLPDLDGIVERIEGRAAELERLSDEDLRMRVKAARLKVESEVPPGTVCEPRRVAEEGSLDALLPEMFAVFQEGLRRVLGQRLRGAQSKAATVLHRGALVEARGGDGRMFASAAAAFLNALGGRGAHIYHPNEFLAWRDARRMGPVFEFLGMRAGSVQKAMKKFERQEAWSSEVTYATIEEAEREILLDVALVDRAPKILFSRNFAVIDEFDPAWPSEQDPFVEGRLDEFARQQFNFEKVIPHLRVDVRRRGAPRSAFGEPDAIVNVRARSVVLTARGLRKCLRLLETDGAASPGWVLSRLRRAIEARHLFSFGDQYAVSEGRIVPIKGGAPAAGKIFSAGLHEALSAREGLFDAERSPTELTVSRPRFLRGYRKLSGFCYAVAEEAAEIERVYSLVSVVVPPQERRVRIDRPDIVCRTRAAKERILVDEVRSCRSAKRPVVVVTRSNLESRDIKRLLLDNHISAACLGGDGCEVGDAALLADAGRPGSVTICARAEVRGIDIPLGGDQADAEAAETVRALGGIHAIVCEHGRLEASDRRLRDLIGRRGEPGSSQFLICPEDELCRSDSTLCETVVKAATPDDGALGGPEIGSAVERVQGRNAEEASRARSRSVEHESLELSSYDRAEEVRDMVREGDLRGFLDRLAEEDLREAFLGWFAPDDSPEHWDFDSAAAHFERLYAFRLRPRSGRMSRLDVSGLAAETARHSRAALADKWLALDEAGRIPDLRLALLTIVNRASRSCVADLDRLRREIEHSDAVPARERGQWFVKEARKVLEAMVPGMREPLLEEFMRFSSES